MHCEEKLSKLIKSFFYDRLTTQMEASHNTIQSYRTGIRMFLIFLQKKYGDNIQYNMLSAENVIDFLSFYTENNNHSASSSNQRLAILKSLARYAGYLYPEDIDLMKRISLISPKTAVKKIVQYLEYSDMKTLLECSKNKGDLGLRDYTIILFMYNTGARVSEVTGLNISQLSLDSCPCVLLYGKGKKERIIPLWQELVSPLKKMIEGRTSQGDAPVFINRNGQRFSRKGISYLLNNLFQKAFRDHSHMGIQHLSPHMIRHTTAMHLLQSGVDMNTIRLWLGHVSIDTTSIYAEADLKMKLDALRRVKKTIPVFASKKWNASEDILSFLENK